MRFSLSTLFFWTALVAVYLALRPYHWAFGWLPAIMAALTSVAVAHRARKSVLLWTAVFGGSTAAAVFTAVIAEIIGEMFPNPPDREDRERILALLWYVAVHHIGYYALAGTMIGACVGGLAWVLRAAADWRFRGRRFSRSQGERLGPPDDERESGRR